MNEYTSLKNLVDELNKEVAKFEQFKKEQDELEQKLLAKEAELAEKSARLAAAETEKQVLVVQGNGRSAELEVENAELRQKLVELERKLAEATKAQSDVLAELSAARAQANEELVVLKRSQPVDAAPMKNANVNDGEISNLRAENNRLQQKNEELRKRNFKILDDVASLEKQLRERISSDSAAQPSNAEVEGDFCRAQLLEERKLVASTIGSIVNSPLNDSSYDDYINGLAKSLKSALKKAKKNQAVDGSNISDDRQAELDNYRSAFHSLVGYILMFLSLLLSQIEMGVNERETFYKDKVAQLESELDKANGVIASANRLRKELRECEFLKKQIQALRKCLGQSREGTEIASPRSGTVKSDESDWEVVSH
ncbi:hypothetical protein GCK32_006321 [Trichostrongylus colubriformis]|uniref:Uncharacterized protein n=1 Tax=Trichostrongylus colubriformis TaxID=6319 RepID=A0AAN8FAM4_TRICO